MTADRSANSIVEIAARLQPFHGDDERLGVLLSLCVGRVMLNMAKRGENWRASADDAQIGHIRDWLRASVASRMEWLAKLDHADRPKKLMKFPTIDAIVAEADSEMLKASGKHSDLELVEGDEMLVERLEDGYAIVRLLKPAALDRESAAMQHCIGNGAYDDLLDDPRKLYLSLRSPSGKAHATMEIDAGVIVQISGKQNRTPVQAHLDRLVPFIKRGGYPVRVSAAQLGYVIASDGVWHRLDSLPPKLHVNGDLNLEKTDLTELPPDLTVDGTLGISKSTIRSLPKGLKVGGDLHCGHQLKAISEGLEVGGNAYLGGISVTSLPDCARFGGSVYLDSSSIEVLPAGFAVNGNLSLGGTPMEALPDGLSVTGDLRLDYQHHITALPAGLKVGGSLFLDNCAVTSLPEGLEVGGNTHLYNSQITSLPCRFHFGRDIDLRVSDITALPDDMRVNGSLLLGGSRLQALPKGLSVVGDLQLSGLPISSLPEDLSVCGALIISNTGIADLPPQIADDASIHTDHGPMNAARFRRMQAHERRLY
jgi:hypothetical protein